MNYYDTEEGRKIEKHLEDDLERRLAYEDHKMYKSIILGFLGICSVIPVSMLLAWVIREGNL